jgi:hypothetical protein
MQRDAANYRPLFYPLVGALLTIWVIAGFWPQYYRPLFTGGELLPRVSHWGIHVHSVIFLAWVAGFALQGLLVRQGRADLHRRVGVGLAVFGFASALVGAVAGFAVILRNIQGGMALDRGATFVFMLIVDLGMFVGFLAAAIHYRRRREIHKRLMLLTTLSLAFIGMGRLMGRLMPTLFVEHKWAAILIMLTPILAAMGHDLYRRRAIHPVYFIGVALFTLRLLRQPLAQSEEWRVIGRAILSPFL